MAGMQETISFLVNQINHSLGAFRGGMDVFGREPLQDSSLQQDGQNYNQLFMRARDSKLDN